MQHTSPVGGPGSEPYPQPPAGHYEHTSPPPDQQFPGGYEHSGNQSAQPETAQASSGLDPKVASLLAYITWVGGVVILLTQKQPSVKFHGAQSILFNVALVAAYIVLTVVDITARVFVGGWTVGTIFFVLGAAFWIGSLALWIVLVVKAYGLKKFKLPLLGNLAEKWTSA